MFLFKFAVIFLIGSFNYWGSCDHIRISNKRRLKHRDIDDYNDVLKSSQILPSTHTEYKYRSVQTGSADVPYNEGSNTYVGPDHNQTKSYLAKIDTTILYPRRTGKVYPKQSIKKNCVKCPFDRTVIAQKRLDGVLIEPPPALSCVTNQPFAKSVFEVYTLFGPQFFFVLPQGTHQLIGKIINKKTGKEEMKCTLKYKVVVRKCSKYQLINPRDLQVKCDLDNIWGSRCTFSCKNGGELSHEKPVICGDNLNWYGDEPVCSFQDDTDAKSTCNLPAPPGNGRFSCEVNAIATFDSEPRTPSGSICRVYCDKQYYMPEYLKEYSVFQCNNGHWNATMLDFCQRSHRKFNQIIPLI